MTTQHLFPRLYAAFNRKEVESVLAFMTEDVSWPKASEGGRVTGKQDIREYWTRQWADFDPQLTVLDVVDREGGRAEVKVRQLVRNLQGHVLSDTELWHVYTLQDQRIARMDILEADDNSEGQSAAFKGHGH